MAKNNPYENSAIEAMKNSLNVTSKILDSYPALGNALKHANNINANLIGKSSALQALQPALEIKQQFSSIFSGNEIFEKSYLDVLSFQTKLLHNTENYYLTGALNSFRNHLVNNNYALALDGITKALTFPTIEAPNIALLKLNKPLMELVELPRGMRSAIDSLHVSTAKDLSKSDRVSYNSSEATFFIKSEPKNSCTAQELNVLCSALRLFDEFTEDDLFSFLRHLSSFYSLGTEHPVGKKILKIVKNIECAISFDSEFYYHARSLDDGVCPFTDEDMVRAPHGITSFGRFNHIGENYFYFSDQESGAVKEIKKHNSKNRVQIARLQPKGEVRLVDISESKENIFLNYCRFPFDSKSNKKIPREYLIPSFFSDCCKLCGFDGIKYYGTKKYRNYVTWSDGHFTFVGQEIQ